MQWLPALRNQIHDLSNSLMSIVVIFLKVIGKALPYWRSSMSFKKWITILAPIRNGLAVRRFMTPGKMAGCGLRRGGMGVID